jgi:hypothetical protein
VNDPFTELARALIAADVRFVVIGVWGANYYATGRLFVTQDQDLFLPRSAANLSAAWLVCEQLGLDLGSNSGPLDQPRDDVLAEAVIRTSSLTTATDGGMLQVDLTLVMAGHDFEEVHARRRIFVTDGVPIPVANLLDIVNAKRIANRPNRLFLATHEAEIRHLLHRSGS